MRDNHRIEYCEILVENDSSQTVKIIIVQIPNPENPKPKSSMKYHFFFWV